MDIVSGVVKWFSFKLGYGFITNSTGEDVFVHYSAIPGKEGDLGLREGDVVEYVEGDTDKGKKVVSVISFTRGV